MLGGTLFAQADEPGDDAVIEVPIITKPVPVKRRPPKYPGALLNRGLEGWVLLEFFVETNGSVSSIEVLDSEPPNAFEEAAINAAQDWTYNPAIVDGQPERFRTRIVLTFLLEGWDYTSPGFRRLTRNIGKSIDKGDLERARTLLVEAEAYLERGKGNRHLVNFLYFRYFTEKAEYERAIYHLRRSLVRDLDNYKQDFLKTAMPTLFKAEAALGRYASADETYHRMTKAQILDKDDVIHQMHDRINTILEGNSPLFTQGFILGARCYSCEENMGRWRHNLSRSNFQIEDLNGQIKTMTISCMGQRTNLNFEPDMFWSIAEKWGGCHLQIVGQIGSEFRLVEFANE